MRVIKSANPSFVVLEGGGQSTVLDLNPPAGYALGLKAHGGLVYVFRDMAVPVTEDDRARYREATGENL